MEDNQPEESEGANAMPTVEEREGKAFVYVLFLLLSSYGCPWPRMPTSEPCGISLFATLAQDLDELDQERELLEQLQQLHKKLAKVISLHCL